MRALSLLVLLVPFALSSQTSEPCPRPAAKPHPAGEVLLVPEVVVAQCRLLFKESGPAFKADDQDLPSLSPWVARDSKGRFFTSQGFAEVQLWSAEGKFLRTFASDDSLSGHLSLNQQLYIWVDPADNIIVRDSKNFVVFSSDLKYVRTVPANGSATSIQASVFLSPTTMLNAEGTGKSGPGNQFNVFDFSTQIPSRQNDIGKPPVADAPPRLRTFGPVPKDEEVFAAADRVRQVNQPVSGEFWVGPPKASARGYELQLWSVDGVLKRTIRRNPSWFLPGSDKRVTVPARGEFPLGDPRNPLRPKPATEVMMTRYDGKGLLYTVTKVTNDKWDGTINFATAREQYEAMAQASIDYYVEVIDVDAGVLLVSELWGPIEYKGQAPSGWFNGGWKGYRLAVSPRAAVVHAIDVSVVKK